MLAAVVAPEFVAVAATLVVPDNFAVALVAFVEYPAAPSQKPLFVSVRSVVAAFVVADYVAAAPKHPFVAVRPVVAGVIAVLQQLYSH